MYKSQSDDTFKYSKKGKLSRGVHLQNDFPSFEPDTALLNDLVPVKSSKFEDTHSDGTIPDSRSDLVESRCNKARCSSYLKACVSCCKSKRQSDKKDGLGKGRIIPFENLPSEGQIHTKDVIETGYFETNRVRKFHYTLPYLRVMSHPVLQRQHFERHTKINTEGFLLKQQLRQFWGLDAIEEETDIDGAMPQENPLTRINYVLQLRLDEVIAMPRRPVDGYDEALIKLNRLSTENPNNQAGRKNSNSLRTSSMSQSSMSSIRSKIANHKDIKTMDGIASQLEANLTRNLIYMRTPLILALLPTLSKEVHYALTNDFEYNVKYCKVLDELFRKEEVIDTHKLKKTTYSNERWLAVIYINYQSTNLIEAFRRLVVKLILHNYLVAFEEKDLSKDYIAQELTKRVGFLARNVTAPFVFTNGVPIGGCSMIYYLHSVGFVNKFFKHSIMDPDQYQRWLHNPIENVVREQLLLKVPMASFPLVNGVMHGEIKVNRDLPIHALEEFLLQGAFVVNASQRKWSDELREAKYSEPRILPYALLKATIMSSLSLMEDKVKDYMQYEDNHEVHCCGLK